MLTAQIFDKLPPVTSAHATFPLWSHDGKRILFSRNRVNFIVDVNKDFDDQTLQQLPPIGTRRDAFVGLGLVA